MISRLLDAHTETIRVRGLAFEVIKADITVRDEDDRHATLIAGGFRKLHSNDGI